MLEGYWGGGILGGRGQVGQCATEHIGVGGGCKSSGRRFKGSGIVCGQNSREKTRCPVPTSVIAATLWLLWVRKCCRPVLPQPSWERQEDGLSVGMLSVVKGVVSCQQGMQRAPRTLVPYGDEGSRLWIKQTPSQCQFPRKGEPAVGVRVLGAGVRVLLLLLSALVLMCCC